MLRGMAKSRRESVEMYRQGNRPELAAKEEAEIAVIEVFLPLQMDDGCHGGRSRRRGGRDRRPSPKEMGKVMAVLRAKYAATLDMAGAGPLVKARLGG